MNSPSDPTIDPAVLEVVVKALERADDPITPENLRKSLTGPYKLPVDRLHQLLEDLAERGQAFRFEPARKRGKPRYWGQDHDQYARKVIPNELEKRGVSTWSKLFSYVKNQLKGYTQPHVQRILQELIAEQVVYRWPPSGRTKTDKFHNRPPDPRIYFEEPVGKIAKHLSDVGVSRTQMLEALAEILGVPLENATTTPTDLDLSELLLQQMKAIQPSAATGALVSIRDLRRSLADRVADKEAFDRAIWRLVEQGRVALHRHDYPSGLSEQERAEMFTDGQGNYYIGIALRLEN